MFHKLLQRLVASSCSRPLASSAALAAADPIWWPALAPQLGFYGQPPAAACWPTAAGAGLPPVPVLFCLANLAAAAVSLLAGVRFEIWEPVAARRGEELMRPALRHTQTADPRVAGSGGHPRPARSRAGQPSGHPLLPLGRPGSQLPHSHRSCSTRTAWLGDNCRVVPLGELDRGPPRSGGPSVAITFDDGYADNHTHALPLLQVRE